MQFIKNLSKQQLLFKKIKNILKKNLNIIKNIYQKYLEESNRKHNNKITYIDNI